ncbi:nucleotidyltransferase family protein [Treponema primitia]|nr:nucleotidyltransferase domain-containing protein [Treponema primitia]
MQQKDRDLLSALVGEFLPHTAVWVFGSRIKGTSLPYSDLDLVVFTNPEQQQQVSLLKEALEESNLPFRVDVLEWNAIPESFKETIKTKYAVIA